MIIVEVIHQFDNKETEYDSTLTFDSWPQLFVEFNKQVDNFHNTHLNSFTEFKEDIWAIRDKTSSEQFIWNIDSRGDDPGAKLIGIRSALTDYVDKKISANEAVKTCVKILKIKHIEEEN